jgi:hypothetical protein
MVHLNWQDRRRRQVWLHTAIVTGQCRVNTDQDIRTTFARAPPDACVLLNHDGRIAIPPRRGKTSLRDAEFRANDPFHLLAGGHWTGGVPLILASAVIRYLIQLP